VEKVVKDARLYVQADNILTMDKLKRGSDPEAALNGDAGGHAVPFKTWSFGINLTF